MSRLVLYNILLALIWVAVSGAFSMPGFVMGFIIGALGLWLIREQTGTSGYFLVLKKTLILVATFLYELVMSAVRVAKLVMSPQMTVKPAIFALPLTVDEDWQIAVLANLITLTPGTLSVDVSKDRKKLYVHVIDSPDLEAEKQAIKASFEKQILEISRG